MVNFEMKVPGAGNASWRILQYPTAFNFQPFEGKLNNDYSMLTITPSPGGDQFGYGYYQFPLVIDVEGVGLVEFPIIYLNFGNPSMRVWPTVDLEERESGSINIENQGGGILVWEIVSKPEWLNLTRMRGVMESTGYDVVMFTVDRTGLEPGTHAGTVQIASNASPFPVTVTVNIIVAGVVVPGQPETQKWRNCRCCLAWCPGWRGCPGQKLPTRSGSSNQIPPSPGSLPSTAFPVVLAFPKTAKRWPSVFPMRR